MPETPEARPSRASTLLPLRRAGRERLPGGPGRYKWLTRYSVEVGRTRKSRALRGRFTVYFPLFFTFLVAPFTSFALLAELFFALRGARVADRRRFFSFLASHFFALRRARAADAFFFVQALLFFALELALFVALRAFGAPLFVFRDLFRALLAALFLFFGLLLVAFLASGRGRSRCRLRSAHGPAFTAVAARRRAGLVGTANARFSTRGCCALLVRRGGRMRFAGHPRKHVGRRPRRRT
jgi:hypothetical protein